MGKLIRSVSGNLLNFKSAAQVPFESLVVNFEPVQSGSGDPSPTNIRPISGWSGANITKCGKNIFNILSYPLTGGWIHGGDGGYRSSSTTQYKCTQDYIPISQFQGIKLVLNKRTDGTNPGIGFYSDTNENSFISGIKNNNSTKNTPWIFTIPQNAKYMRFTVPYSALNIQLEVGETATAYEPYTSISYPVSWTSQGTVYGGYVDLVSGILSADKIIFARNSSTMDNGEKYPGWRNSGIKQYIGAGLNGIVRDKNGNNMLCNVEPYYRANTTSSNTGELFFRKTDFGVGEAEFKEMAIDMQFIIPLNAVNPITYQLTPQQLKALRGANNIWSDANGTVEAEFEHVETADIHNRKKRIMMQDPELPPKYKRIKYLQSTGGQYILTPLTNIYGYRIKIKTEEYAGNSRGYYGWWNSASQNNLQSYDVGGHTFIVTFGSNNAVNRLGLIVDGEIIVNGTSISYGNMQFTTNTVPPDINVRFALFGYNRSTGVVNADGACRIYYAKFFDNNGNIIGNFIPAIRNDSTLGMYDTVTKQFYTNQGTGTFIAP